MDNKISDWSKTIERLGKQREQSEKLRLDAMEEKLPEAIEGLSSKTNEELLDLLMTYSGSAFNLREMELRQAFRDAIRAETLGRMRS